MENYRKPPRVNRYWKRPKPKVYDCNVRDAERFYQESYKTYLSEKEEAAARAARSRSIDSSSLQPDFYPHLLAGNIRRDTSARANIDLPPLPPSLSDSTRARLEAELSTAHATSNRDSSFTARSAGLPVFDPVNENATLEERLNRLKKLREDLGMPAEPQTGGSTTHTHRSESVGRAASSAGAGGMGSDLDSYRSERTARSRIDTGPEESSSYSLRSERSARVNGTAGPAEDYKYKSDVTSNGYKYRSERSSDRSLNSDYGASEYKVGGGRSVEFDLPSRSERQTRNLSPPKIERKREREDYSFSSSSGADKSDRYSALSSSAGASSVRKTATKSADTEPEVDDDKLASMMKKLPSSQEILERISKMELDD